MAKMTEPEVKVEKENTVDEDMFVSDFVHKIKIPIANTKTGKVTEYEFGIKEISGFEEDQLSKTAIVKTGNGKIEFKTEEANIAYLEKCIVLAPWDITRENIKRLTSKVRNKLLEEAKKINEIQGDALKK